MALMLKSAFFYASFFTIWIITLSIRKAIHLRRTNKRHSNAHFVYAGINGCYVIGSIFSLFFGFFSVPGFWSYFLFVWIGNLASIVLYIVSSAVPANFQVKVTGFTFVLAATVLTLITLTFYPPVLLEDIPERMTQQDGLAKMIGLAAGVALMIVILMPFMLKISLTTPMKRLLEGVEKVNAGMLETQVKVGLHDEIGMLTENFNHMTQSLKKAQDELTEYTQNLEKKVARRTKQLQDSLNELKRTQAQLIQSEKMASLGELTAGIAHEIKNPLNFINNFSEVSIELSEELQEELAKDSPDKENVIYLTKDITENLQKINQHGTRAGGIITSMLEHSRASKGERQLTDINGLVVEYLNTSYESMQLKDKNFSAILDKELDTTLEKIDLIPQDFGRVLLNLFNNAFYAVNEKKKNLNGAFEPKISVHTLSSNNKIMISVKDNGIGIPKDILHKIYQPFFTTKPAGAGTGLGLSLSYDIITKGYNGELKVKSNEGEGTEFVISLPA
jgi:signal transduction histidine kinase